MGDLFSGPDTDVSTLSDEKLASMAASTFDGPAKGMAQREIQRRAQAAAAAKMASDDAAAEELYQKQRNHALANPGRQATIITDQTKKPFGSVF